MKITIPIKDYKFPKDDLELIRFWRMAKGLVQGNGMIRIEVSKSRKKPRSNAQNSYYFGVVIPHLHHVLKDLGHEIKEKELHLWLKAFFLEGRPMTILGQSLVVEVSTADLSTVEFQIYIDKICRWCAEELSVVIPSPEEKISHI